MNSTSLYTAIAVVLALVVVCLFFFFPNYLHGIGMNSSNNQNNSTDQSSSTSPTDTASAPSTSASLSVQDINVGAGTTAQSGDKVVVEYVGKLQDGTIFDQSSVHTEIMPGCSKVGQFCFTLGEGQVIQGWEQGILGMKVGGERTLIIPPSLGYGAQAMGTIPANSTLIFDVKLVGVNQPASGNTQFAPTGPASD